MKIIDLLNKIANGEELPRQVKHKNYVYEYQHRRDTENSFNYMCNENGEYLSRRYFIDNILNDEIEVIEENKEIEHINIQYWRDDEYTPEERINVCMSTIDELIDEINKLKKEK